MVCLWLVDTHTHSSKIQNANKRWKVKKKNLVTRNRHEYLVCETIRGSSSPLCHTLYVEYVGMNITFIFRHVLTQWKQQCTLCFSTLTKWKRNRKTNVILTLCVWVWECVVWGGFLYFRFSAIFPISSFIFMWCALLAICCCFFLFFFCCLFVFKWNA